MPLVLESDFGTGKVHGSAKNIDWNRGCRLKYDFGTDEKALNLD